MNKKLKIREQLEAIETHLANAEAYVAKGVNVEGSSWLHFGDFNGKSGHPLWMQNFMIPTSKGARAKKEKALKTILNKEREKRLKERKTQRDISQDLAPA
jgi:hypothetical protein